MALCPKHLLEPLGLGKCVLHGRVSSATPTPLLKPVRAEMALDLNSVTYTTLKNILKNNQDKKPVNAEHSDADTPPPSHENLRVGEWK